MLSRLPGPNRLVMIAVSSAIALPITMFTEGNQRREKKHLMPKAANRLVNEKIQRAAEFGIGPRSAKTPAGRSPWSGRTGPADPLRSRPTSRHDSGPECRHLLQFEGRCGFYSIH